MGRCVESPVVKLKGQGPPAPRLLWEPVKKGREDAGEILVAFELFLVRSGAKTVSQCYCICKVKFAFKTSGPSGRRLSPPRWREAL